MAQSYDVVLTSETVYSPASMKSLVSLLEATVAVPAGVAFVAAKTYYFGVGGGTRDFEGLLKTRGVFDAEVCRVLWTARISFVNSSPHGHARLCFQQRQA